MDIQLIDLPKPQKVLYEGKSYDIYDMDLYPNRKFKKEVKVLLYQDESWGNIGFFNYFMKCDREDIKVIVYSSLNFFPIASLIGHRCIMTPTNILNSYQYDDKKTSFLLNWKLFSNGQWIFNYNFDKKEDKNIENINIDELFNFFKNRNCYISKDAYNTFCSIQHEFPINAICTELTVKLCKELIKKIEELKNPNIIGMSKEFQNNIIKKYNGNINYLSYQILASILRGWKFIGFGGSASLLLSATPINCILLSDYGNNVPIKAIEFKNKFNTIFYGYKTYGWTHNNWFYVEKIEHKWEEIKNIIYQSQLTGKLPKIINIKNKKNKKSKIKKVKIKPKYSIIINRIQKFK
jgi:hypothetical protein